MTRLVTVAALLAAGAVTCLAQRPDGRFEHEMFEKLPPAARKAIEARANLRYSGKRVVAFRHDGQLEKHSEYVMKDGPKLRIEFPSGSRFSGQVIVENARERRHYFPSRNEIHITPPRHTQLFEHLFRGGWRGDARQLKFVQEQGQRIAGLPTELVKVQDDAGNVLQSVNIEPRTGLVLKRQLYDSVGTQIGYSEFTQVNLHPDFGSRLFVLERRGAQITTPIDDLQRIAEKSGFLPVFLSRDSGFELDSSRTMEIAEQRILACQYASKNGRLMLFQLAQGVDQEKLKRRAPPQIHTYALEFKGRTFALVGPLDEEVLKQASKHLRIGTKHHSR